eukprot:scaffold579_cov546-Prasinococcus_capsulatus_cf.AAC.5
MASPTLTQRWYVSAIASPSVKRARPPVGWHNTALQLPHTTTDWEWLKTVVLQRHKASQTSETRASISHKGCALAQTLKPRSEGTYMLKQP